MANMAYTIGGLALTARYSLIAAVTPQLFNLPRVRQNHNFATGLLNLQTK